MCFLVLLGYYFVFYMLKCKFIYCAHTSKHFHFQTLVFCNRWIRMESLIRWISTCGFDGQLQATCYLYCSILGKSMHIQPIAPHMPASIYCCFPITLKRVFMYINLFSSLMSPPLLPFSITLSSFLAFIYVPFFSIIFLKRKINTLPSPAVRNSWESKYWN